MTTSAQAFQALRDRAEANITLPLYWQDETNTLPDTPTAFVYFELDTKPAYVAGYGGGRGSNLYRNEAELNAYVFVPIGEGVKVALTHGETVAAVFRSFRDSNVSCFEASVHPVGKGAELIPHGLDRAVGNYACAVVIVQFHFDQTG